MTYIQLLEHFTHEMDRLGFPLINFFDIGFPIKIDKFWNSKTADEMLVLTEPWEQIFTNASVNSLSNEVTAAAMQSGIYHYFDWIWKHNDKIGKNLLKAKKHFTLNLV